MKVIMLGQSLVRIRILDLVSKLNKNVRNVKTHSRVFLSKDIIYMYKKK